MGPAKGCPANGNPRGMTCSLTELCQSDCRCAGSQPRPTSEMGGKVRKSMPELDHCCCQGRRGCKTPGMEQVGCGGGGKGLQARTCFATALGRGAQRGEEQRACMLPKATEGPVPPYQLQDTTHVSLACCQRWSYFYSH